MGRNREKHKLFYQHSIPNGIRNKLLVKNGVVENSPPVEECLRSRRGGYEFNRLPRQANACHPFVPKGNLQPDLLGS